MSAVHRLDINEARTATAGVVDMLRPACERIEIAGSIRRGRVDPKDGEIVILPRGIEWHSLTDDLVRHGIVEKAVYGESSHRWGPDYRGVLFQGVKVEIFTADADSWGYQYWLRTGPGDANTCIMSWLGWKNAPLRFQGGYAWWSREGWRQVEHGKRKEWVAGDRVKLSIPDEETLFAALGLPYIEPPHRNEMLYKRLLGAKDHQWGDFTAMVAQDDQARLVEAQTRRTEEVKEDEMLRERVIAAERAYNAGVKARHEAIFTRAAAGEPLAAWEQRIVKNRELCNNG